jgi:cytochrome P450
VTIAQIWKDELEKLVAQSAALAKAARDEPIAVNAAAVFATAFKTAEDLLRGPPSDLDRKDFVPVIWPPYGREEINRRVAGFRAHQQKMAHDREAFSLKTMARVLVPVKN